MKFKLFILSNFLLLFCFSTYTLAQQISFSHNDLYDIDNVDSIEKKWSVAPLNTVEHLKRLYSLENVYLLTLNSKSGTLIDSIKKIEDGIYPVRNSSLYFLYDANKLFRKGKLLPAYQSLNFALNEFIAQKDTFSIILCYLNLCEVQPNDKTNASYDFLVKGEKLALKYNNNYLKFKVYQTYYQYYYYNQNDPNNQKKLIEINDKMKSHIIKDKYEQLFWAIYYGNLGVSMMTKSDYKQALIYLSKSNKLHAHLNSDIAFAPVKFNFALSYYHLGDFKKSLLLSKESYELAKKAKYLKLIQYSLELQKVSLGNMYRYKESIELYEKINIFKDSISKVERQKDVDEFKVKYNAQQIENENIKLSNEQLVMQRQRDNIFILLLVFFILMVIVTYFSLKYRKLNKKISIQNKSLTELTKTKDYFMSIIAHDIKQPIVSLFNISKTIKYLSENKQYKRIHEISDTIDQSSLKTIKIIDNLFQWALIQNENKVANPRKLLLKEQIDQLIAKYVLDPSEIAVKIDINETATIFFDSVDFEIIFRNLLDNSMKNTPKDRKVMLQFVESEPLVGNLKMLYSDNGSGITEPSLSVINSVFEKNEFYYPKTNHLGFGIILIAKLMAINHSSIKIQKTSEDGTTFELIFRTQ